MKSIKEEIIKQTKKVELLNDKYEAIEVLKNSIKAPDYRVFEEAYSMLKGDK